VNTASSLPLAGPDRWAVSGCARGGGVTGTHGRGRNATPRPAPAAAKAPERPGRVRAHVPTLPRAASHPDFNRRSRNSTESTVRELNGPIARPVRRPRGSRTVTAGSEFHRPRSTLAVLGKSVPREAIPDHLPFCAALVNRRTVVPTPPLTTPLPCPRLPAIRRTAATCSPSASIASTPSRPPPSPPAGYRPPRR